MASAIEDVSSLPGETVHDQEGRKIGEVKEIYGVGDDDTPMWVTVETSTGLGRNRLVFIPLARLKHENEQVRTPYSFQHLQDSPEVDAGEELSEEDDQSLRVFYAIGLADQEMVENAQSYASQVPDEYEPAEKIDASAAEGPVREIDEKPPGERAREADDAEREQEGEEDKGPRKATAADVLDGDEGGKPEAKSDSGDDRDEDSGDDRDEDSGDDRDEDSGDDRDEDGNSA